MKKNCVVCGAEFKAKAHNSIVCSEVCRRLRKVEMYRILMKDPVMVKRERERNRKRNRKRRQDPAYYKRINMLNREYLKDPVNRERQRQKSREWIRNRAKLLKIKLFQKLAEELKNVPSN